MFSKNLCKLLCICSSKIIFTQENETFILNFKNSNGKYNVASLCSTLVTCESPHELNQIFAYAKTKDANQLCSKCTADEHLCFIATWIVQLLFSLNPKFQASSHFLWCRIWLEAAHVSEFVNGRFLFISKASHTPLFTNNSALNSTIPFLLKSNISTSLQLCSMTLQPGLLLI